LDQLLGHVLGAAPETHLAEHIFRRSGGNAFFAEELLAANVASNGMPASVRDAVLGRLASLAPAVQRLVRAAAVVSASGPRVPHDVLAAVTGLSDAEAVQAARAAVSAYLIRAVDDGYMFRHVLTREAVEDDLLPRERTQLHAAAARAFA